MSLGDKVSSEIRESSKEFVDRIFSGFYEDQLNEMFSDGPSPGDSGIVKIPDDVYEQVEAGSDVFPATQYLLERIEKMKCI